MTNTILVLFHSLYDKLCIRLKNALDKESNVRTICVDHPDIKETILKDKVYQIQSVPSILVLHEDGTDELYQDNQECTEYFSKYYDVQLIQTPKPRNPFLFDLPDKKEDKEEEEEKINIKDIAMRLEKERENGN